jgi:hypothetical protein
VEAHDLRFSPQAGRRRSLGRPRPPLTFARRLQKLRCQGCAREYAIVEGIPVLLRDPEPFGLLGELDGPSALLLAAAGPDGTPLPHALAQLSSYLGSYESGFEELAAKLRGRPPVPIAAAVRAELVGLGWTIEDDCDLSWTLRHDARAATIYLVHFMRARRGR